MILQNLRSLQIMTKTLFIVLTSFYTIPQLSCEARALFCNT